MEALRLTGFYIPASVNLAAHLAPPNGRQLGKGLGTRMDQFTKRPRVGGIAGLVGGRYSFFLFPYYFFFTTFSRALAGAQERIVAYETKPEEALFARSGVWVTLLGLLGAAKNSGLEKSPPPRAHDAAARRPSWRSSL